MIITNIDNMTNDEIFQSLRNYLSHSSDKHVKKLINVFDTFLWLMQKEPYKSINDNERTKIIFVHLLLIKRILSLDDVKPLTSYQANLLGHLEKSELIESKVIAVDEAKLLTNEQAARLISLSALLKSGHLTATMALNLELSSRELINLKSSGITTLVQQDYLSVNDAIRLGAPEVYRYEICYELILGKHITLEGLMALTVAEFNTLKCPAVMSLVLEDRLSVMQACSLTLEQKNMIQEGVIDDVLSDISSTLSWRF